jgi:Rab proteins geranylgeranyltransferase component A
MVYHGTGRGVADGDAAKPRIQTAMSGKVMVFPPPSVDLVFDDSILESVKEVWKVVMATKGEEALDGDFLKFDPRPAGEEL